MPGPANSLPSLGTLLVRDATGRRSFELSADGLLIGRAAACDVVLADPRVSSRHARLWRDPAGRWVLEDLASKNGTWLGGERISRQAMLPGQVLHAGPFRLSILPAETPVAAPPRTASAATIAGDPQTLVDRDWDGGSLLLTFDYLKQLNELTGLLAEQCDEPSLHAAVCEQLAATLDAGVLVLRLCPAEGDADAGVDILAWRGSGQAAGEDAPPPRLSRRVLGEVYRTGRPVSASSVHISGYELALTMTDRPQPRAVVCCPIAESPQGREALYVELDAGGLSPSLRDFVHAAASQVAMVRKALLLGELRTRWRLVEDDLVLARQIQHRLTPPPAPRAAHLDLCLHYGPAAHVGGDYCDAWQRPDGRTVLVVGDVAGHGLAAAMVMATLHAALRTGAAGDAAPADMLRGLNRYLLPHLPDNLFVTMLLVVLDGATGSVEYVNAGHLSPMMFDASGRVQPITGGRQLVLGVADVDYASETVQLPRGAGILMYTDGIEESRSLQEQMFGQERLMALLGEHAAQTSERIVAAVVEAERQHRRPLSQQDDVTILAARRLG